MDFAAVRRTVIVAMFSDDVLFDTLVLKGGNALHLVHGIGDRTSLDIDFSISSDFENPEDIGARIERALRDRFDALDYVVFDFRFQPRPIERNPRKPSWWGGYEVEFKLIARSQHERLGGDLENIRRNALVTGTQQRRVFRIEISKYEYCERKQEKELDAFTIVVYSPEMIAGEKLRAICQQMPEYSFNVTRSARARDFYDIHTILTDRAIDLSQQDNKELLAAIFAAKEVSLALLGRIVETREFHRGDWQSVTDTAAGDLQSFDFYFDSVLAVIARLEALWKE